MRASMRYGFVGLLTSLLTLLGCEASPSGSTALRDASIDVEGEDAAEVDSGLAEPTLVVTSPTEGQSFARADVVAGRWAARVLLTASTTGAIARAVVTVEGGGAEPVGEDFAAPFEFELVVPVTGEFTFVVRGYDAGGALLAMDSVTISVTAPADASCRAMLDALPLTWTASSATQGVPDPVFVQPMIGGVSFRYTESATAGRMLMDCSLAVRVAWLAEILAERDVVEAEHIGVYNYRCIGGGTPETRPGCTLSEHAKAQAIDLHAFTDLDGVHYDTVDDWVIRPDSQPVCGGTYADAKDAWLRDLACEMNGLGMFNIILTPDYNSAHRNHFHVDLTPGSDYIGATVQGLDPAVPGLGDSDL